MNKIAYLRGYLLKSASVQSEISDAAQAAAGGVDSVRAAIDAARRNGTTLADEMRRSLQQAGHEIPDFHNLNDDNILDIAKRMEAAQQAGKPVPDMQNLVTEQLINNHVNDTRRFMGDEHNAAMDALRSSHSNELEGLRGDHAKALEEAVAEARANPEFGDVMTSWPGLAMAGGAGALGLGAGGLGGYLAGRGKNA